MTRDHGSKHTAQYPVLSDQPVEIHGPKRKLRIVAISYALAILVTACVGAYIAAAVAVEQSDDVRNQLRAELDRRARERDKGDAQLNSKLDQERRDICTITALLPPSPAIIDIRTRYDCGSVSPSPAGTPQSGTSSTPQLLQGGPANPTTKPGALAPTNVASAPPPAKAPVPAPTPVPPSPPVPEPPNPLPIPEPCLLGICLFVMLGAQT